MSHHVSTLGEYIIPVALEALLFRSYKKQDAECSCGLRDLRGAAMETILELIAMDDRNCRHVTQYPSFSTTKYARKLLKNVLKFSGGFVLQLDITECMLHCYIANKKYDGEPSFKPLQAFPLDSILKKLADHPSNDLEISQTLHSAIADFNRSQSSEATVRCIQARRIVINGTDAAAAEGQWVDFAADHFVIGVNFGNSAKQVDSKLSRRSSINGTKPAKKTAESCPSSPETLPPQYLTIELNAITKTPRVSRIENSRTVIEMSISSTQLLQDLQEAGISGSCNQVTLLLEFDDVELEALKEVPAIDAELKKYGLLRQKESSFELSKAVELADLTQPEYPVKTSIVSLHVKKQSKRAPSVLEQIRFHNDSAAQGFNMTLSKIENTLPNIKHPEAERHERGTNISIAGLLSLSDEGEDTPAEDEKRRLQDNCISTNVSPRRSKMDSRRSTMNHSEASGRILGKAESMQDHDPIVSPSSDHPSLCTAEGDAPHSSWQISDSDEDNKKDISLKEHKQSTNFNTCILRFDLEENKSNKNCPNSSAGNISEEAKPDPRHDTEERTRPDELPCWIQTQHEKKILEADVHSHLLSCSSGDDEGKVELNLAVPDDGQPTDNGSNPKSQSNHGLQHDSKLAQAPSKTIRKMNGKSVHDMTRSTASRTLRKKSLEAARSSNIPSKPAAGKQTAQLNSYSGEFAFPKVNDSKSLQKNHSRKRENIAPEEVPTGEVPGITTAGNAPQDAPNPLSNGPATRHKAAKETNADPSGIENNEVPDVGPEFDWLPLTQREISSSEHREVGSEVLPKIDDEDRDITTAHKPFVRKTQKKLTETYRKATKNIKNSGIIKKKGRLMAMQGISLPMTGPQKPLGLPKTSPKEDRQQKSKKNVPSDKNEGKLKNFSAKITPLKTQMHTPDGFPGRKRNAGSEPAKSQRPPSHLRFATRNNIQPETIDSSSSEDSENETDDLEASLGSETAKDCGHQSGNKSNMKQPANNRRGKGMKIDATTRKASGRIQTLANGKDIAPNSSGIEIQKQEDGKNGIPPEKAKRRAAVTATKAVQKVLHDDEDSFSEDDNHVSNNEGSLGQNTGANTAAAEHAEELAQEWTKALQKETNGKHGIEARREPPRANIKAYKKGNIDPYEVPYGKKTRPGKTRRAQRQNQAAEPPSDAKAASNALMIDQEKATRPHVHASDAKVFATQVDDEKRILKSRNIRPSRAQPVIDRRGVQNLGRGPERGNASQDDLLKQIASFLDNLDDDSSICPYDKAVDICSKENKSGLVSDPLDEGQAQLFAEHGINQALRSLEDYVKNLADAADERNSADPANNLTWISPKRKRKRSLDGGDGGWVGSDRIDVDNLLNLPNDDTNQLDLFCSTALNEAEDLEYSDDDGDQLSTHQFVALLQDWRSRQQRKLRREQSVKAAAMKKEVTQMIAQAHKQAESEKQHVIHTIQHRIREIERHLASNHEQIEIVTAEYESRLSVLREQEAKLRAQAEGAIKDGRESLRQMEASTKRKLGDVYAAAKEKMAIGQRSLQRAAKRAKKLPADIIAFMRPLLSGQ